MSTTPPASELRTVTAPHHSGSPKEASGRSCRAVPGCTNTARRVPPGARGSESTLEAIAASQRAGRDRDPDAATRKQPVDSAASAPSRAIGPQAANSPGSETTPRGARRSFLRALGATAPRSRSGWRSRSARDPGHPGARRPHAALVPPLPARSRTAVLRRCAARSSRCCGAPAEVTAGSQLSSSGRSMLVYVDAHRADLPGRAPISAHSRRRRRAPPRPGSAARRPCIRRNSRRSTRGPRRPRARSARRRRPGGRPRRRAPAPTIRRSRRCPGQTASAVPAPGAGPLGGARSRSGRSSPAG